MRKASIRRRRRPTKPLPDPEAPRAGHFQAAAPELLRNYTAERVDPTSLKAAGLGAFVVHFVLFLIVLPAARQEPIPLRDVRPATVIQRWQPPAPPSQPRKTNRRKTNPIPIPDPTPREPEPIYEEESDIDFGDPDAEFAVGLPDAPPGPGGARLGAVGYGDDGVTAPILLEQILPEFSAAATRAGIQGDVYIEAVVTELGTVADPKLIRGLPDDELNQRALEAIAKWRFQPGTQDGEPVAVVALFEVTFRIH